MRRAVGEDGGNSRVVYPPTFVETASPKHRTGIWFICLVLSVLIVVFNRFLIPNIELDWLNVIPVLAVLFLCYCLIALEKIFGWVPYVSRRLPENRTVPKSTGSFLFSRWFRSCLLFVLLVAALEFGLRCLSYHRSLQYERQGDLLFTPVPDQRYMEKISHSYSEINSDGLRGQPIDPSTDKEMILSLGDSITYGYGVDDAHTYPALLQAAFDRKYPGRYSVVNGGVDAYPIAFEEQKFLYLWNRGLRPNVVIVGYSMNEGWLGNLVDSDDHVKQQFEQRIRLKNFARSFALYNLVVEGWARHYCDRMKGKLVPGTNFSTLSQGELEGRYEGHLRRMLNNLQTHNVKPVFLLFCGFDGKTGRYDTLGPFQRRFAEFAQKNGIPLLESDRILEENQPADRDLARYFIDQAHMNASGTEKVATKLGEVLPSLLK